MLSRRGGPSARFYDAVIVGSGFGGAMTAATLSAAGLEVLVVERGHHVARGEHSWDSAGTLELTPHYPGVADHAEGSGHAATVRAPTCVGGGSVFYGGVSLRMREGDFDPDPRFLADSGAAWPFPYAELAPYYDRAEQLLDVAGAAGADPLEPPRSGAYPQPLPPLSPVAERIAGAARALGLTPFPLPLAINYRDDRGRAACRRCTTCDTFACAISAKNDVATVVLSGLRRRGVTVAAGLSAQRLHGRDGRVEALECRDAGGRTQLFRARRFYLGAGALGTPALLLASGLDRENPAGQAVGRHLSRHCSAIVMGLFPRRVDPQQRFHKQVGIHDFYDGDPVRGIDGPLGALQQISSPPVGLLERELPRSLHPLVAPVRDRLTGLLAMAYDEPRARNRIRLPTPAERRQGRDLVVEHEYSSRDLAARRHLVARASEILREAGAVHRHVHLIHTFSHAVGTVRMGADPRTAPVDPDGRYRGVANLHVVDGSVLPTSAAVNPSLTIAATALRAAEASLHAGRWSDVAAAV